MCIDHVYKTIFLKFLGNLSVSYYDFWLIYANWFQKLNKFVRLKNWVNRSSLLEICWVASDYYARPAKKFSIIALWKISNFIKTFRNFPRFFSRITANNRFCTLSDHKEKFLLFNRVKTFILYFAILSFQLFQLYSFLLKYIT